MIEMYRTPSRLNALVPAQTPRERDVEKQAQADLRGSPYAPVRGVDCRVEGGVLRLHGRVPTFYMKQMALSLMGRHVRSGMGVENQLEVALTATS
jgi:hypothetical protein